MAKCYKCGRKASYFLIQPTKEGATQTVETCGYHRKVKAQGQ
mgnify:CR=1 FL=1